MSNPLSLPRWRPLGLLALSLALVAALWLPAAPAEACGGSRSGLCTWLTEGGIQSAASTTSTIHGSTWASVETRSPIEMRADWVSGKLFGELPGHGPFVMGYQADRPSFVSIISQQAAGVPFFPATARQTLHYYLDLLDENGEVARTLVNLEPMTMVGTIGAIPPFGSVFETDGNVEFYDTSVHPPELVVTLQGGAQGWIANTGGYNVQLVDFSIDEGAGTFETIWEISSIGPTTERGVSSAAIPTRWFATGLDGVVFDEDSTPRSAVARGAHEAAGSLELTRSSVMTLSGTFDPSQPRAGVALHAVSQDGTKLEGHSVFSFFEGVDEVSTTR